MWDERTHEILQLSSCLLNDAVLSAEDDTHTAEVANFGTADDEGVNVESSAR